MARMSVEAKARVRHSRNSSSAALMQQKQNRRDEAFAEKSDADPDAEHDARESGAAQAERVTVDHHGAAGEQRVVGDDFVRADQHAEAADEGDSGGPAAILAEQFAAAEADEQQRQCGVEAGCQACAIMQRQDRRQEFGKKRSRPVEQRRLVHVGFVNQRGDDPVVALEDVVDQAEAIGFVGFPRVMSDESGEQPHRAQQEQEACFDRGDFRLF